MNSWAWNPRADYHGAAGWEIAHFCIDRHNGGVNAVFMDLSARKVLLKELWYLTWHKGYEPGNIRWPWPDWMDKYPDPIKPDS